LVLSCNGCSIYSIVCALIIIVSFERKYWNVKKRKFWESVKDCVVLMSNTCQNYLCFQVLAICHCTDSGNLHKSVEMIKLSIMFARWNIQIQNLNKGCAWGKLLFLPIIFCLGGIGLNGGTGYTFDPPGFNSSSNIKVVHVDKV